MVGARKIDIGTLQFTLQSMDGQTSHYLKGITKERLVILDGKKILDDERLNPKEVSEDSND
jgi:chemotaxis signal transduction protein